MPALPHTVSTCFACATGRPCPDNPQGLATYPSTAALQAAASHLGLVTGDARATLALWTGSPYATSTPYRLGSGAERAFLPWARRCAQADLHHAMFGTVLDNGETHTALRPVPAHKDGAGAPCPGIGFEPDAPGLLRCPECGALRTTPGAEIMGHGSRAEVA